MKPSPARQGVLKVKTRTLNQHNEPVQVSLGNLIVRRRPAFHEPHTKEHSDESAQ